MGRAKKQIQVKEPVTIRYKEGKNGIKSVYLDCYVNGKRWYEFLSKKIGYIEPVVDFQTRTHNAEVLQRANAIKMQRISEIYAGKDNVQNIARNGKMLLLDWMDIYAQKKLESGHKDKYIIAYTRKILLAYAGANVQMQDIDKKFCLGFLNFIKHLHDNSRHEPQLKSTFAKSALYVGTEQDFKASHIAENEVKYIKPKTQENYYRCFTGALNAAVREEIIACNPFDNIASIDKIKVPESTREYLTIDEVKQLMATKCKNENVKNAFLFSCFCGLRISDIYAITWGQITQDGEQMRLQLSMQKTKDPLYLPISAQAQKYLPQRGIASAEEKIFHLPRKEGCNYHIGRWAQAAGITKKVSFHVARHTFATMMLTLGADLYTTSKLLGHTNILTTQIYAKIINKKKDEAVNLTNGIF